MGGLGHSFGFVGEGRGKVEGIGKQNVYSPTPPSPLMPPPIFPYILPSLHYIYNTLMSYIYSKSEFGDITICR